MTNLNPSFEATYQRLLSERPVLKDLRERELSKWRSLGIPSRKDERWHYTNVSGLAEKQISLLSGSHTKLPPRDRFPSLVGRSEAKIVFYNGRYVSEWSDLGSNPALKIKVLSQSTNGALEDFKQLLEKSEDGRENSFSVMNTAYYEDVVHIEVQAGKVLESPIAVMYFSDSAADTQVDLPMVSPRLSLKIGKSAEASMFELHSGTNGHAYFSNAVTDLDLQQAARLSFARVQAEGDFSTHVGTVRVTQERDSFSELFQFSFGANLSRHNLKITLKGEGAEANLDGLYLVNGKQHIDNYTLVDHAVPNTVSSQVYKGILDEESRAVFNGHVKIRRDAQKSNAAQLNNNLILSKKAEADTKPELEIDADDVKASHGAAIGQIDPEHVFYLQARAIPKAEAIQMLARGFAYEILYRLKNQRVREQVAPFLDQRLNQMNVGAHMKEMNV